MGKRKRVKQDDREFTEKKTNADYIQLAKPKKKEKRRIE